MEELLQALEAPTSLKPYKAVMSARDGEVVFSGELLAADDADALAQIRDVARNLRVDVWEGLRFIGLVDPAQSELA